MEDRKKSIHESHISKLKRSLGSNSEVLRHSSDQQLSTSHLDGAVKAHNAREQLVVVSARSFLIFVESISCQLRA